MHPLPLFNASIFTSPICNQIPLIYIWQSKTPYTYQILYQFMRFFGSYWILVANSKWGADKITLLHLYRSLVRSKLDSGCIVYGSAKTSYLKALDAIHHQGLRLCMGAYWTSPVDSLYVEVNASSEPTVDDLGRLKFTL